MKEIRCGSCGYTGPSKGRTLGDIALGIGSALLGGGPGFVEHWRDIISGKTCPRCANPKTEVIPPEDVSSAQR